MSPRLIACVGLAALATACVSQPAPYASGMQTVTLDPSQPGPVQGVGIESQDIVVMADRMMHDMLTDPAIAGQALPPRIVLDAEYFRNESAQRINTNIIVDNLRVNLQRAAGGRMRFVSRESFDMVADERDMKRNGVTDIGTLTQAKAQLGVDYRMRGRLTSTEQIQPSQGLIQRYNQVTFEMVNLETSEIVWTGMYQVAHAGADDVIYR
ncbi:MAG: penicillin-binding protein activator LpoB [Hyphomonadaceae bacterium]